MFKKLFLLFALVFLSLAAACSNDEAAEIDGDEAAEEAKTGDIVVGFDQDLSTIDPHGTNDVNAIQIRRYLYQTLVARELDMSRKPGLAAEWEQTDETTWNFKLAEGVTFHNGSEFTAEDVKASLERVQDPSISAPTVFLFEMIEDIEIVNDYELNITTSYPFAPLPDNLAHTAASIMSKESIDADYQNAIDKAGLEITAEEYYEMRDAGGQEFTELSDQIAEHTGTYISENPDGTNYVKFKTRAPGQNIEFERFEDFAGESNIDNLTFVIIPESGSMMAELESGGINITTPVDMAMMDRVQSSDSTEFVEAESLRTNYLGFNTEKEPFDDVKVRQAIDFAIDREELKEGIYDGQAAIPNSMVSSSVFGYDEELPEISQDIDEAQAALRESNHADGFDATIWVNDSQDLIDSAVYIQEQLKELNINITIEQFEMATFMERLGQGQHDMFLLSFTASTGDADYLLSALTLSTNRGFGGNRAFYTNEDVDAALENARSATEDADRLAEYTNIHNMLREDVPYAPLVHPNMTLAYNTAQLDNVELDAAGYIRLENLTFK
ncbi:glutathione ABC transporter substrate-binding protein [Jeotgalicoccus nanhaiensis]|uniref:Glutathione ABC transporter substrate-binding protein n=1 Tax=Jeotgalicoccus nanhaiensis TaxID=568603 RepID=A0ABR9XYQ9_9STAP|nr:ABC transporter substrate-binding protein [Jeotgalicoccus nanhaiensis]MBF0753713.1 glutathione ABC transporter substrate-binding protein [Jeotgalicoccus nanhaiensis]TFU61877.1 glutathione ABC transporter substrate-binding protein [Jeotgalicoccus nanhaiensis]